MRGCKKKLAVLWSVAAVILILLLIIQTIMGHYEDKGTDAIAWLLPNILPTLSLIIGVLVADARGKDLNAQKVDRFFFHLAFSFSCVYLLLVLFSILAQPFAAQGPLELLKLSNWWLGPIQGLVTSLLGVFFVKSDASGTSSPAAARP
jgi:hypothetical protein